MEGSLELVSGAWDERIFDVTGGSPSACQVWREGQKGLKGLSPGHQEELHPGPVLLARGWLAVVHVLGHCSRVGGGRLGSSSRAAHALDSWLHFFQKSSSSSSAVSGEEGSGVSFEFGMRSVVSAPGSLWTLRAIVRTVGAGR